MRRRRRQGLSLIETMVAIALLGVIVVTLLAAFGSVTLAATRHQQQSSLDRLARSDAEFIKSQSYSVGASSYANISAPGYTFSQVILYYDPAAGTFTSPTDQQLQQIQLTVTAPSGGSMKLILLKVQP